MWKRIGLFLIANIAILVVISILLSIFNVQPYLTEYGLNYQSLFIFALIIGFSGSFISLFMSKWMAKRAFKIRMVDQAGNPKESWLVSTVQGLCTQKGIGMPEVGIYDSPELNAFATGWNKNKALVAVSTGLLDSMEEDELQAVLAHEVSHIANGDMVTMTLLQGVVNTFVIFFARVAAFAVMRFLRRGGSNQRNMGGFAYYGISILFQIFFGILATMVIMWFSRYREFRADAGSAKSVGSDKMIRALRRLQQGAAGPADNKAESFATMKISSAPKKLSLFASHPPIEERIRALERLSA